LIIGGVISCAVSLFIPVPELISTQEPEHSKAIMDDDDHDVTCCYHVATWILDGTSVGETTTVDEHHYSFGCNTGRGSIHIKEQAVL